MEEICAKLMEITQKSRIGTCWFKFEIHNIMLMESSLKKGLPQLKDVFLVYSIAMKKRLFLFVFLGFWSFVQAQVRQFDKLELNYSQGNYTVVYRKANRLMDNPDFDYSKLPLFYKSISVFQLSMNKTWSSRKSLNFSSAAQLYRDFLKTQESKRILEVHQHEVIELKQDLMSYLEGLKRDGSVKEFNELHQIIDEYFESIPSLDASPLSPNESLSADKSTLRGAVVHTAGKYLGVPYVWSGESPSGFDCSGFTSFVLKTQGKEIPRRAVDQYNSARKIKEKDVDKGDLVFFSNGSEISHVGIVVSERGKPIVMIHASSSKGIVLTELGKSSYWMSRLAGFGTFMN
jgi:cell wall-associated NlpC family hydrolase